jgi:electron transfer flavoprotein alpha subunit
LKRPEIRKGLNPTEAADLILERLKGISPPRGEVFVSGGRGIGSADFFGVLRELADILEGEIASSRANVESGWIARKYQVGQTGRRVSPEIYMACGISGTPQHLAGMRGSKHIIAVNINENAPIFHYAELGIVGDVKDIIPSLIARIKREL